VALLRKVPDMASIVDDPNGRRRILFVGPDTKRKTIRLGKIDRKGAESICRHVEALLSARIGGQPVPRDTANWLPTIGDALRDKLAAVGLIENRQARSLGAFLAAYLEQRRGDSKPATAVTIRTVVTDLTGHFHDSTDLRAVTVERAEAFKKHYQDRKLAPATIYRRLKMAKMLFGHAVKLGYIEANPFDAVTSKNHNPPERRHYVTPTDTRRLLDAANPTWRTIIALSRFGGLRCPSEVLTLRWENVNLAAGRMVVQSPKTEHLEGRAERVVPVFAALRPFLEEAWELAAPGDVYVVGGPQGDGYRRASHGPNGWVNANLRTTFEKLIRRAGLSVWPKVFHNLRASCETDLMANHPIHVVTAWIGNTPKIALGHYLQTLDADFEKALKGGAESGARGAQNAAQTGADPTGRERTSSPQTLEEQAFGGDSVHSGPVGSYCTDGQGGTRTHTYCYARF
jgi:integrase